MTIYNKIDKYIKTNLFIDTLNLIGIVPFSHINNFNTFYKEFNFKNKIDEEVNNAYCEFRRPRGDYQLIFPLKTNINIYKKYFINNNQENIKLWEIISHN